jgi:lipoyltransferase and lipoate-protein ligase
MENLQIILSDQNNPFLNLAVENILTDDFKRNTVTMFLWKNQQTVVIGINQNPYSECNVKELIGDGGHLARRRTGGGAVYHDLGNLNFSFIADKNIYDVKKQLSVIQYALKEYGLETEISGRNDVTFEGRKFSGNAFFNGKEQNLHHGTILIKTNSALMQKYLIVNPSKLLKNGVKSVASRIINLSEVADITSDNIIPHLTSAFEKIYGHKAEILDFESLCHQSLVQENRKKIESDDYLYGKWSNFNATKKAIFAWGCVEVALEIDETEKRITDVKIASDCLNLSAIEKAKTLLTNASATTQPVATGQDSEIVQDILNLIYQ